MTLYPRVAAPRNEPWGTPLPWFEESAQRCLPKHGSAIIDCVGEHILYIHDTIEAFGCSLAAIREQWQTDLQPALHAKAARVVERAAEKYFRNVDDTTREAARIATGRSLTPEMVRELCPFGWRQIFSA